MSKLGCCKGGSACDVSRCSACYFERNFEKLSLAHPWLEHRTEPTFGVGCSVCRQAYGTHVASKKSDHMHWRQQSVTSYLALQPRRLTKHEESEVHRRAACKHVPDLDEALAPTSKQFKDLQQHIRTAPIGTSGISTVGGQKKCRKLLWCLAESHREAKRGLFDPGMGADQRKVIHSTTLFQDARAGRLSLRFTTASSKLVREEGFFGTSDLGEFGLDSVALMNATMATLRRFCTRFHSPPHLEKPHSARLDPELFARVVASIEVYVSDSASDEIRAGFMLARQSTALQYMPHLPCLKVIVRDKPHAVCRNLSRPWKADPFLEEVSNFFVFESGSPVRLIQYSEAFKAWFASAIKRIDPDVSAVSAKKGMLDLGFAPQRFASAAKPMMRVCLFYHAFLTTVNRIAWEPWLCKIQWKFQLLSKWFHQFSIEIK